MKQKFFLYVAMIGCLGVYGSSSQAQGSFVFNGTFDTDATGWSKYNVAGSGWDAKGNPGGCFVLSGPAYSGITTISQTVEGLTPGAVYMISADYEGMAFTAPDSSFGVALDGNYLFKGESTSWQHFSFLYTAVSSHVDLSLSSSLSDTRMNYRVDNISIVAVPEPNTFCLIGMAGLTGWCFLRRKMSRADLEDVISK